MPTMTMTFRNLVMAGGRVRAGHRIHRVPVLEGTRNIGGLLDIGEKKKWRGQME